MGVVYVMQHNVLYQHTLATNYIWLPEHVVDRARRLAMYRPLPLSRRKRIRGITHVDEDL